MSELLDQYISPRNLFGLVENTAPFLIPRMAEHPLGPGKRLIDCGDHPEGYLEILQGADRIEEIEDYFAFCLACHHATVATFVPTDVDAKIRGLLWRRQRDGQAARRMFELAERSLSWSIEGISRRATELAGVGPVSGHNGEQLSVLAGALGYFLQRNDEEYAERAANAIDAELEREALEFRFAVQHKGCELDVLRLAASLTHNAGDLDQGISFWPSAASHDAARKRFARLAHENTQPYGGAYRIAARIYKTAMSPEGHRNYPLRGVKALRRSPDFLLPLGPFLDDWGALIAVHPALDWQDRADVFAALLHGCRTIAGQRGYYRALHGIASSLGGNIEHLLRLAPARVRAEWKDSTLRKQISIPRISFESMMKKLVASAGPFEFR